LTLQCIWRDADAGRPARVRLVVQLTSKPTYASRGSGRRHGVTSAHQPITGTGTSDVEVRWPQLEAAVEAAGVACVESAGKSWVGADPWRQRPSFAILAVVSSYLPRRKAWQVHLLLITSTAFGGSLPLPVLPRCLSAWSDGGQSVL